MINDTDSLDSSAPLAGADSAAADHGVQSPTSASSTVSARGTAEGFLLRLDGKLSVAELLNSVEHFVEARRSFLAGNTIVLEWFNDLPSDPTDMAIRAMLSENFSIVVRESRMSTERKSSVKPTSPLQGKIETHVVANAKAAAQPASLFDGVKSFASSEGQRTPLSAAASGMATASLDSWDSPDARVWYGTLRSGQRIESEHTVVVCGDVNAGAEIVAGGDVIVMGTLRGVAHAGAFEESGGGRFIFALQLMPTQLRIGTTVSRGSEGSRSAPEIARADGGNIVVQPYQARSIGGGSFSARR